ncbi:TRAP transporter substrate-binding protein [Bacillus sp. B15-48]|uniref:TRAP transporter substrate-binding protein n=1 Tax=Bacillus sp. B15-48 TaxID=1548601 RepID=UPI00193F5439|nr:TRAP transporter substrate-binding protein [Bacillus sp. B15-48]MBM4761822.1 hypothetical protein [Bacillus sp. B15-48]
MKKVSLFLVILLVLFMSACGNSTSSTERGNTDAAASNESNEKYVLKLAHGFSTTHFMHTFMEWFNNEVQERSDGRLSIEIFPSAQLMPVDQELPSLIQGQIDMVHSSSPVLTSFDPIWNFFELPFIFDYDPNDPLVYLNNRAQFNSHEKGGQHIANIMDEKGVKVLAIGYIDTFGSIFTNDKLVTDAESSKGLRIRTPGGIITPETLKAIGASSVTISGAEAIPALQQGMLDGLLTTPMYAYDAKLPVNKYTVAPLFNPVTPVLISKNKFESLPKDLQEILVETGKDYEKYVKETIVQSLQEQIPKLESEMGVEIYYPTEEEIASLKEATKTSWDLFEKGVEGGKELIDALQEIQ